MNVCGNHWLNPDEIRQKLHDTKDQRFIALDFRAEGPSLAALDMTGSLLGWCQEIDRDPKSIVLMRWPNPVEATPFTRGDALGISHFFKRAAMYDRVIDTNTHEYRFGMFVGRRTAARMRMLWDLWRNQRDRCLFSLMPSRVIYDPRTTRSGIDLDGVTHWIRDDERAGFYQWCDDPPISGLDGHTVQQQYQPGYNTNYNLLSHYHKFDIEIVIETYSMGDCFMPTEKTVRPIVGRKPMIVHGPRGYLARLRELGFRTWGDHWDESYDDLEGVERWHAMSKVITQIDARIMSDDVVDHNRRYLDNLS